MRILCVCLGNICRSPMAEGAVRRSCAEAGVAVTVDSAGTGDWHLGDPPDPMGLAVASARGYDNSGQRARAVCAADFEAFDLILAMDRANLAALERLRPGGATAEVRLFDPEGGDVPDPYGRSRGAFEAVLERIEAAAGTLAADLAARGAGGHGEAR